MLPKMILRINTRKHQIFILVLICLSIFSGLMFFNLYRNTQIARKYSALSFDRSVVISYLARHYIEDGKYPEKISNYEIHKSEGIELNHLDVFTYEQLDNGMGFTLRWVGPDGRAYFEGYSGRVRHANLY